MRKKVSDWYLMAYQPVAHSEFLGPLCLLMADSVEKLKKDGLGIYRGVA
jgi:hypothetical protein